MKQHTENVRNSYDQVADEYTKRLFDELQHKPLDQEILARFARKVEQSGPVCDMGCGPGHVTRFLNEQGTTVQGIDLSPRMIEFAQQMNPGITFRQGDMAALDLQDNTLAGIVAFYSIIHFPRSQVVSVLQEFRRVLQPNGLLLLSFHESQEIRHFEEWWGKPVLLDFVFFERAEMEGYLQQAGFEVEECIERDAYPDVEVQTRRAYILARKPDKP